jgi:hypothetical protein
MLARFVYPLVALLLVGTAAPARAGAAEGSDSSTAVLGLEAIDAPDAVANDITDALRQRVASTKGMQLVQGKDLVEIKLVFSCPDEAAACMTQAGKSLGVARLIFGNVKRTGGEYTLTLKLLDVGRGSIESTVSDTIQKRHADSTSLRAMAPQWLARLSGKSGAGSLQVQSNVEGALVIVDGAAVGMTGSHPLNVPDVAPGNHEITVQRSGYASNTQQFTMGSAQSLPLRMNLTLLPPGGEERESAETAAPRPRRPEAPGDEGPSSVARPGFWIAMALSAASFAAATKFGLDVRRINADLDPLRSPVPVQRSMTDNAFIQSKLDEGDRAQVLQWVFVGVGSAFAVAGGFLLYKGYLDKEPGSGGKTSDNHGLRIFPSGNASSGGVVAEFDF